jgi:hypothetical protein
MRKLLASLQLCLCGLAACTTASNQGREIKLVPSVRLSMVWSPEGPESMARRTRALRSELERAGFQVTLRGTGAPEPTYPFLFISAQHDRDWCLGGVLYIYTSKDIKDGFELYQRDAPDPAECSAHFVAQILARVRPR